MLRSHIEPMLSGLPAWSHAGRLLSGGAYARNPLQERKHREKTTDKARKDKERSKEAKELSRGFYKGLMQDSDYQGEDYEVFSAWLRETE